MKREIRQNLMENKRLVKQLLTNLYLHRMGFLFAVMTNKK